MKDKSKKLNPEPITKLTEWKRNISILHNKENVKYFKTQP